MPATGKTPIQFYRSTTSGNVPSAANLSPGELALNIADDDMTMYFENASGVVKRFFNNPAELKYPTADGTLNQGVKTDGSKTLSFGDLASAAITNNTRQAVTSSATTTIDLASGQVIDLTMAANITTLSFTNVPASGTPVLVQIVVRNASSGTAYTIAWPNSVYWSGQYTPTTFATLQTAPTLATGANGVTTIALLTTDGGTKWRGWVEGTIPGGATNALYSWGKNSVYKQLGLGDSNSRSSPTQLGALTNWIVSSSGNDEGAAIKLDGTLWTWGSNFNGSLGNNSISVVSSPIQIGALTNWSKVSAGKNFMVAIKTDGTMWSWGSNAGSGALGLGNSVNTSSPVQVGGLTNWLNVSSGAYHCIAIKTDGTLWSWGKGSDGRLGLGNNLYKSSPNQIGSDTDWATISAGFDSSLAIKTNGTLWVWGYNGNGNLGQNDRVSRSSPVQVGALTDWAQATSNARQPLAIKTDGTLWSWGTNNSGQLGLNDIVDRSSPVQIGALTTWAKISKQVQGASSLAIKTDGTLWGFGNNFYGELGLNTRVNMSSPVQIGGLTTWVTADMGAQSSVGMVQAVSINPA